MHVSVHRAFRKAIEKVITPTTQVLDVGAGQGLLSMLAARAGVCTFVTENGEGGEERDNRFTCFFTTIGAAHITACEKHIQVAKITKEIIRVNGFEDKIALLNKHSYQLVVGEDMPGRRFIFRSACYCYYTAVVDIAEH